MEYDCSGVRLSELGRLCYTGKSTKTGALPAENFFAMMGGKMAGAGRVGEIVQQISNEFADDNQIVQMEHCEYAHELDLIWAMSISLVGTDGFSLAVYDDRRMVARRGEGYIPAVVPTAINDKSEPEHTLAGSTLLLVWRRSVQTQTLAFLMSMPDAVAAKMNSKVLFDLGKIGIHLLEQASHVHLLSRRLRQSTRERDVVSGFVGDGLLVLDQSGFLRYINDLGKKILRIDDERQRFRDVLGFEPIISDVFERREGYVDRTVVIPIKGVKTSLTDTAIPIMDDQGAIVSVVNIFRMLGPEQPSVEQSIKKEAGVRIIDIVGQSDAVRSMRNYALQVSKSVENVLIYGEPGTGKSLLAKAIHGEGAGGDHDMLVVDCTRLSVYEFEKYVVSARMVNGESGWMLTSDILNNEQIASLFFDGIDSLPISTQLHLFSALASHRQAVGQSGALNRAKIRIMASVSDAIGVVIQEQRLHPKLHGFLSEASVLVPPLRNREGDLPLYVASFFNQEAAGNTDAVLSDKLLKFLGKQSWVGNLSQLRFVVRELLRTQMGSGSDRRLIGKVEEIMSFSDIPSHFSVQNFERLSMSEAEKQAIYLALQAMDFNLSKAAQVLGISRPTLYAKMKKYNLNQ